MGLLVTSPREIYDALVPLEYQPIVESALLMWCVGCWVVAIVLVMLCKGKKKKKKLKKELKDR